MCSHLHREHEVRAEYSQTRRWSSVNHPDMNLIRKRTALTSYANIYVLAVLAGTKWQQT